MTSRPPAGSNESVEVRNKIIELQEFTSGEDFQKAIEDAGKDPRALEELLASPRGYFANRGVAVPPKFRIKSSEGNSYTVCVYRIYGYMEVEECFTVSM